MAVMSFLANFPSKFGTAKSQILSSLEISSLQETFSGPLRTETNPPQSTQSIQMSNALVSKTSNYEPVKQQPKSNDSSIEA